MQQQQPPQGTQHSENMPPVNSHGGHELFDAHEVIATIISMLDQYQLYYQHMQDQELKSILNRQYTFMTNLYNTMIETFQTGQKPTFSTEVYNMTTDNNVIYGLTPVPQKKPNQSVSEITDAGLSGYMLGQTKGLASLMTMTALEMTNPVLRRVVSDSIPNVIEMSYEIFIYQNKHSYYQVPQLAPADMTTMLQSYTAAPPAPLN
ncbi:spore coat protein [Alteribacillus sp. HJP-4]|uniref:spore coat protein n=1 Tax=Alteribacillus sp. HJP-4 TaxID=2775394 RepID=UPI0035CD1200